MRTIGVEIEFGGMTARQAAEIVRETFGGSIIEDDPHAYEVRRTAFGDFSVKLDTRISHSEQKGPGLSAEIKSKFASLLGSVVSVVIPQEVVTPPLPIDRLVSVDTLIERLRAEGACGTESSVFYAFGLHLNPEVPDTRPDTILAILKAFALLSPWLWREVAPDGTRRLLGFADPYPDPYVRRIAAADYWPDMPALIDDYLAANPTRNRDLDALPLLAFIDEARVRARLPHEKIGRRPTFHYRLPDARVSEAGWTIATDWNRWVAVERLADDRDRLAEVGREFLQRGLDRDRWAEVAPSLLP